MADVMSAEDIGARFLQAVADADANQMPIALAQYAQFCLAQSHMASVAIAADHLKIFG